MQLISTSGPAEILASSTATTFFGNDLRVRVQLGAAGITVALSFVEDGDEPSVTVVEEAWGLSLTLHNFDGTGGRGSASPVPLGELGDDLLFFHFRVFRWGETEDRTVHYTFYRAAKADVGWQPDEESP
jgi:hypothetical protein